MDKTSRLKEYLENKYNGLDFDEVVDMIQSCKADDLKKKYKEGLIKLRNSRGRKIIDRRIYKMDFIFENDINLDLSPDAYYCYGRLKDNILADNSCRCYIEDVNSILSLSRFIKISRNRTTKAVTELKKRNIVQTHKVGNYTEFYINPIYCRFGQRVQDKAIELFGLSITMFEDE